MKKLLLILKKGDTIKKMLYSTKASIPQMFHKCFLVFHKYTKMEVMWTRNMFIRVKEGNR